MDDATRHPDDATLFDLIEGALAPADEQRVRAHLSHCAACAAFVQAAQAGAPVTSSAVEAMPHDAAADLHAAVTAAWRERVAGIAATEAAQDAADAAGDGKFGGSAPVELEPPAPPAPVAAPRRRRSRRLVPVLAFVVLGTLAGTSLYIGEESSDTSLSEIVQEAEEAGEASMSSGEGAMSADEQDTSKVGRDAAVMAEPSVSGAADSAVGGVEPPPAGYDEFIDRDRICIVTRDPTQLALLDGRVPMQITRGPLGIYLVCG